MKSHIINIFETIFGSICITKSKDIINNAWIIFQAMHNGYENKPKHTIDNWLKNNLILNMNWNYILVMRLEPILVLNKLLKVKILLIMCDSFFEPRAMDMKMRHGT